MCNACVRTCGLCETACVYVCQPMCLCGCLCIDMCIAMPRVLMCGVCGVMLICCGSVVVVLLW
jgi:hypothetical protein